MPFLAHTAAPTTNGGRPSAVGGRSAAVSAILTRAFADRRRSLLWWTLGLGFLLLYTMGMYPLVAKNTALFEQMTAQLPPQIRALILGGEADLFSAAGFLKTQLFVFMMPLLFLIFAIGFGSRTVAGEEETRTLELLLAQPVRRADVVLAKYTALVLLVAVLVGVVWAWASLGSVLFGLGLNVGYIGAQAVMVGLLALVYGGLALLLGCLTGRRSLALGIATTMGLTDYLLNSMRRLVPSLDALEPILIFAYYGDTNPLRTGWPWTDIAVLATTSLLFLGLSVAAFGRRDLRL